MKNKIKKMWNCLKNETLLIITYLLFIILYDEICHIFFQVIINLLLYKVHGLTVFNYVHGLLRIIKNIVYLVTACFMLKGTIWLLNKSFGEYVSVDEYVKNENNNIRQKNTQILEPIQRILVFFGYVVVFIGVILCLYAFSKTKVVDLATIFSWGLGIVSFGITIILMEDNIYENKIQTKIKDNRKQIQNAI